MYIVTAPCERSALGFLMCDSNIIFIMKYIPDSSCMILMTLIVEKFLSVVYFHVLQFILVFASYDYEAVSYQGVEYPAWGEAIGWLVACASIIMIPAVALIVYCQKSGHYKVRD